MNPLNLTIADLNALDRDAFVEALGWIFEDSPWVAERAWARRPFVSVEALHQAMIDVVQQASEPEQLAFTCSYRLAAKSKVPSAGSDVCGETGCTTLLGRLRAWTARRKASVAGSAGSPTMTNSVADCSSS